MDGLVEAFREPGVVLHLRHAPSTGAGTPGEQVVRQSERKFEEVKGGVPQSVAEQDGGESGDAEEQGERPDLPPLCQSHVVPDQWAGKVDGSFQKRIGVVPILLDQRDVNAILWRFFLVGFSRFHRPLAILIQRALKRSPSVMIDLESKYKINFWETDNKAHRCSHDL